MKEAVLFIAPSFPPVGGPGTNRSLQFVRHLAERYEIHVVTLSLKDLEGAAYPRDDSMTALIPDSVQVHRLEIPRKRGFQRFMQKLKLGRLHWWLTYPRSWEGFAYWPPKARPHVRKLIAEKNIRLIYTSSGPFSPMLMAASLSREVKIPWIADLRDPFTDGYMWRWPSVFHWSFCRWMEGRTLRKAQKVIVNTPAVKRLYLKRGILPESKLEVITNGY